MAVARRPFRSAGAGPTGVPRGSRAGELGGVRQGRERRLA